MEKENHHIRRAKKFGLIGLLTFTIAGTGLALASGINYFVNKADNNFSSYPEYSLKIDYSK
jgi:hypothetical protein